MPDNTLKNIAVCAVMTAVCCILSLIESFIPLPFLTLLPGVRLGFANIGITLLVFSLGKKYALGALLCKCLLVFLFSGNGVSLCLSLGGGLCALLIVCLMSFLYNRVLSLIGISILSACMHAVGQTAVGYFFIGQGIIYYLPYLMLGCIFTGIITGTLAQMSLRHFLSLIGKGKAVS